MPPSPSSTPLTTCCQSVCPPSCRTNAAQTQRARKAVVTAPPCGRHHPAHVVNVNQRSRCEAPGSSGPNTSWHTPPRCMWMHGRVGTGAGTARVTGCVRPPPHTSSAQPKLNMPRLRVGGASSMQHSPHAHTDTRWNGGNDHCMSRAACGCRDTLKGPSSIADARTTRSCDACTASADESPATHPHRKHLTAAVATAMRASSHTGHHGNGQRYRDRPCIDGATHARCSTAGHYLQKEPESPDTRRRLNNPTTRAHSCCSHNWARQRPGQAAVANGVIARWLNSHATA